MYKVHILFLLLFFLFVGPVTFAQVKEPEDTFFLLKKKGLLKKLGKSIYREPTPEAPIKAVNPFLPFKGLIIRSITIGPTGFNKIVNDTLGVKKTFASKLADRFHRNTLPSVIRKNIFFKEGDKILPVLLSDNERYLRDLPFIRDTRIVVETDSLSPGAADIIIITSDVFSLGGNLSASNTQKIRMAVRDENLFGTGDRLEISGYYEKERAPNYAYGAVFTKRNIRHSFISLTTGFNSFSPSFNSGRFNESNYFISADKPLMSTYTPWTGNVAVGYNLTDNNYFGDSVYNNELKYRYLSTDIWAGYNIGYKNKNDDEPEKRVHHFTGIRSFYSKFLDRPALFKNLYNYSYADINGLLLSYSLYKQNFYRTNYIYGFGRSEDVPVGFSGAIISGYTNKEGSKRSYYGLEVDISGFSRGGAFTGYTFKTGSFFRNGEFQDAVVVAGISHFSKLLHLTRKWNNRNFVTVNFTQQYKTYLSSPLVLESGYGIPYLRNSALAADKRFTVKVESVFFNSNQLLGFHFAPFIFSDVSLLNSIYQPEKGVFAYSALGGGIRTRNENLTFGTIELRGFYFPRVYGDLKNWKVELSTNIRFRYSSAFVRRPEFVAAN